MLNRSTKPFVVFVRSTPLDGDQQSGESDEQQILLISAGQNTVVTQSVSEELSSLKVGSIFEDLHSEALLVGHKGISSRAEVVLSLFHVVV